MTRKIKDFDLERADTEKVLYQDVKQPSVPFQVLSQSLANVSSVRESLKQRRVFQRPADQEITFEQKLTTVQPGTNVQNLSIAEIISSDVIFSNKGTSDRTSVSLEVSCSSDISFVRILRADIGVSENATKPSIRALSQLALNKTKKDVDSIYRLSEDIEKYSVGSQMSEIISTEEAGTAKRVTGNSTKLNERIPLRFGNIEMGKERLVDAAWIDQKVASNPSIFLNIRSTTKQPEKEVQSFDLSLATTRDIDKRRDIVLPKQELSNIVVEKRNNINFKQIASVTVKKNVFSYVDQTTLYGKKYIYVVIPVSKKGIDGQRSASVTVEIIPPLAISKPNVQYAVAANFVRFIVNAKNADRLEIFRAGSRKDVTPVSLGLSGSLVGLITNVPMVSSYKRISDVVVNSDGMATFFDKDVVPGDRVSYRIYSVDCFGRKHQTPFECDVEISDGERRILFEIPKITIEQTSSGEEIKVTAFCNDKRIKKLIFSRIEKRFHETSLRHPCEPDRIYHQKGTVKKRSGLIGPILPVENSPWTGTEKNDPGKPIIFFDKSVRFDRIYQYSVYGVDDYGNTTGEVVSKPIGVYVKPVITSPVNLSGTFLDGKIILSWDRYKNELAADDYLGDQDVLSARSVKNIYQVEKLGKEIEILPYTTESYFVDSEVELGKLYSYRVLAMQSGGFISTFSDTFSITPQKELSAQQFDARLKTNGSTIESVILTWFSNEKIDYWEIERFETNKLASSRLNNVSFSELESLKYSSIGKVFRESSRGLAADYDLDSEEKVTGTRKFFDKIDPANSYVYRIRMVEKNSKSSWSYKIVTVSDKKIDERLSKIPQEKRKELISSGRPISSKGKF